MTKFRLFACFTYHFDTLINFKIKRMIMWLNDKSIENPFSIPRVFSLMGRIIA